MTLLAPFELHRSGSVAEATALIGEHGDEAVLYCGGTELLLVMKLGFAAYGHLVDIKPIAELSGIDVRDGVLRIGAAVTHRAIERSPLVATGWPKLAAMERGLANVRVRTTGTLGGNLAFADPHSDPAAFLLAVDARLVLGRGDERRSLPYSAFVLGPYTTALEPGELVVAIEVPALPASSGMAQAGEAAAEASDPVADANGSAGYKGHLVNVLVGRAVRAAVADVLGRGAATHAREEGKRLT